MMRTQPYDELPDLLTPEEARQYLGVSRNTMYELLRRNEVPHLRFGRLIRVPKSTLCPRVTESV